MKRRQVIHGLLGVAVGAATVSTEALARLGHPLTPLSVAGVHRRRRRRYRRAMYVGMSMSTLPYGCPPTLIGGFYTCAGVYYRPVQQGNTTVYVCDHMDPGANTNVEFEE